MAFAVRAMCVGCLLAVAATLGGCGAPTRFDPAAFNDPATIQKNADTYWKRDGWWGGMKGSPKVAIAQFNVDYVTENVSKSKADPLSVIGMMEMAGVGR